MSTPAPGELVLIDRAGPAGPPPRPNTRCPTDSPVVPLAEELDRVRDDLAALTALAVLRLPLAVGEAALDGDLAAHCWQLFASFPNAVTLT